MPDDGGEDDLPGLEPDEPAQTIESAQAIEPELTAGERIDRAVEEWKDDLEAAAELHQWTDKELDDWFEDDFRGLGAVQNLLTVSPGDGARLRPSDLARSFPDLQLAVDSLLPSRQVGVDLGHLQWADLARDTKIGFREAWEGEFGTDPSEWPQHSSGSQTHASPDQYQAAGELKLDDVGALSLSGGPEFEGDPAVPATGQPHASPDQYLASKELSARADAALQLSPDAMSEHAPAAPATGHPQQSPDQYQAADELSVRADAALQLSPDAMSEHAPAAPATGPTVPRWVWVGGGFGVLGLVLAAGFLVLGGSDESDSVAGTEPAAVVEDPATAVEDERVGGAEDAPDAAADDQPAVAVQDDSALAVDEEPAVAVEEEPAVAVEDEPTVAVEEDASSGVGDGPDVGLADPFDLLTVVEASLLADPAGDLVARVGFVVPWLDGAPITAEVFDMFVQVGVAFDGQFNAASWSVTAGKTRGVGYIYGDAPAAIDGVLWLTPDGVLFGKLPGPSSTGGLSASALGPDAVIAWDAYVILEEGGEIQRWNGEFPLGEIGELSDATPPGAQPEETDFGPVTLTIPGG